MKQEIKFLLKKLGRSLYPTDLFYPEELLKSQMDSKAAQLILKWHYQSLTRTLKPSLPTFAEVGFRQYSQFEEDGILLYLFSLIAPKNRICLEICAGSGIESNTANLIINHGWWGHLFDGNSALVAQGTKFYANHKDTFLHPPKFRCTWITAENINELITESGLCGDIDLLSLDMDGVDYWIWKALHVTFPSSVDRS